VLLHAADCCSWLPIALSVLVPVLVVAGCARLWAVGVGRARRHVWRRHVSAMGGRERALPTRVHEVPFVGTAAEARAVLSRLVASGTPPRLGRSVHHASSASGSGPAAGGWSDLVAQARGGRQPPDDCGRTPRRRGNKRKERALGKDDGGQGGSDDAAAAVGDGGGSVSSPGHDAAAALGLNDGHGHTPADIEAAARRARRRARQHEPILVEDFMQEALTACIQRSCGVASSLPMRKHESPVTARVIGDPTARSRAIVLRSGAGKRDVAILWVSARGGLLCSCFEGTENAMFLSASARGTKCAHSSAFTKALSSSGVSPKEFRSRMRIRADAADYTVAQDYGSVILWAVLYHSVYSVVSFSSSNVALCIAPGCRRFRGRCGHVRVVRNKHGPDGFNDPLHGSSLTAVKARKAGRMPPPPRPRARFLKNEEEDEGLEKQPSDTMRAPQDADLASLCDRIKRNLLPCSGEVSQGEVWNRTADWRTMFMRRSAGPVAGKVAALRQLGRLFSAVMCTGAVRDLRDPLFEPFCGSCGQQREERHEIQKERALLTTHHPTAEPIKVSFVWSVGERRA